MRITDEEKIKRVIKATKELIVRKGFHGASISEIAKNAKVSDGYLYRHYKGKEDLVTSIFEEQLKEFHDYVFELIEARETVRGITEGIISYILDLYKNDPTAVSFANSLVYDFSFKYPDSRAEAIDRIIMHISNLGKSTQEIGLHIREIDILSTLFTIPVKYIDYKLKGYGEKDSELHKLYEVEILLNICMNALK